MKVFVVLAAIVAIANGLTSGSGVTTRYWDCCKPSCSWGGKASVTKPVRTCKANGNTTIDSNTQSGCNGGSSYVCNDQQPFTQGNVGYGFAAASISGQPESQTCCACYEMTFTNTAISGQKMIVQVTNTGSDLNGNHFDLMIPGGGVGIFNGCQSQWGAPSNGWGQRYGGISSQSECNQLPTSLRAGCNWRFGWFKNADNPSMKFTQVRCPTILTQKSQCVRTPGP
uniref:Endoglucanase n=2 Tax=Cryptopygus antarcticus TaxID=187623 RepID=GUN_CRYAT|nr:RecName: Full=Endoglucanase; AltName: Full=CaCel; AltName: Full=Cellulase; AltName: Full=Endo-beta-1,4-glucanase; Flags: Precursor [Cryptopygus antarcticus]ACV50414.1 endo-beta-1,4-glucanase [Cryptopygus antarcticus]ACV50415.1 endo-beta-1,4-glucanase [Cryptopygus antarcticus]